MDKSPIVTVRQCIIFGAVSIGCVSLSLPVSAEAISRGLGAAGDVRECLTIPRDELTGYAQPYKRRLRDQLLTRSPDYYLARTVCMPSSAPEWVLTIGMPKDGRSIIELAMAEKLIAGPTPSSIEIAREYVEMDAVIAERIHHVWITALYAARYPRDPQCGVDGVSYHFSAYIQGIGWLAGKAWSPDPETPTMELVRITLLLKDYVRTSGAARRDALRDLQGELNLIEGEGEEEEGAKGVAH